MKVMSKPDARGDPRRERVIDAGHQDGVARDEVADLLGGGRHGGLSLSVLALALRQAERGGVELGRPRAREAPR